MLLAIITALLTGLIVLIIIEVYSKQCVQTNYHDTIRILSRQAARWAAASAQDSNALIAVLHANYGAGYLWAIKDILQDDDDFKQVTDVGLFEFEQRIVAQQDRATRSLIEQCKTAVPTMDTELLRVMRVSN